MDRAPRLWDDAAFIARVEVAAAAKGMTLHAACRKAKLAGDYLLKPSRRGRNTDHVMRLAAALGVPVSVLLGEESQAQADASSADADADALERLSVVAAVSAHLYVALGARPTRVVADPVEIVNCVIELINKQNIRPQKPNGSDHYNDQPTDS